MGEGGERESEIEGDIERQRKTETYRQTEREREGQRQRQTDRHRQRDRDRSPVLLVQTVDVLQVVHKGLKATMELLRRPVPLSVLHPPGAEQNGWGEQ